MHLQFIYANKIWVQKKIDVKNTMRLNFRKQTAPGLIGKKKEQRNKESNNIGFFCEWVLQKNYIKSCISSVLAILYQIERVKQKR